MKGRGTRTVDPNELEAVTPDAGYKTHFVLVDAVGVTESDKTETQPLERERGVSFEKLLQHVAQGDRREATLSSLANRLARLQVKLEPKDLQKIEQAVGKPLHQVIGGLLAAVNPDVQIERARAALADTAAEPTPEQVTAAAKQLAQEACAPFKPAVRNLLTDLKKQTEQVIDKAAQDVVTYAGYDEQMATKVVTTFKEFIEQNKDELTALQIIYNHSYGQMKLTFDAIKQVAEAIGTPPYSLAPDAVWNAYARLEKNRVRGARPERLLTDIISLVRFAVGEDQTLEPFADTVNRRYEAWLAQQGDRFTEYQLEWLELIKNHVAASLTITPDDFQEVPFSDKGGLFKVRQLFGADLDGVINELNEVLAG
ncbi:MAG TPA: type I restriction-modification enzyme R subunit C-terminal domain-containing protein [Oscillatoriaceae cyanobacterium]